MCLYIDREVQDASEKPFAFGIITATLFRYWRGYAAAMGAETAYV
jgi:hypothetical protein